MLTRLKGTYVENRYEWTEAIQPILLQADALLGVEAIVVIFLSATNKVVDFFATTGTRTEVTYNTATVINLAERSGACKLIFAHNHPTGTQATPSDQDVSSSAALYFTLPAEIELVDDLVVCKSAGKTQLKSVLATRRFKRMVKPY
jgi:DNA repair protein RadC